MTLLIDQLAERAERLPSAPLLPERSGEAWRPLTNARAWAQSGAAASWLIAQGYGPQGRSLSLPAADDTPERAVLMLAALRAGALVVDGPLAVEYAVLVHCSIDAAVAERRLHLSASTPARQRGAKLQRHGDFVSLAELLDP